LASKRFLSFSHGAMTKQYPEAITKSIAYSKLNLFFSL
jgi:hypothetical protein